MFAQARADAAEAAVRERERQASTAADAAAVRVRGLEATLADLRDSADAPEAELRSRAAEVWQTDKTFLPSSSEHVRCTSVHVKRRSLLVLITSDPRPCTVTNACQPHDARLITPLILFASLNRFLVAKQASGRAAAAEAELETLRARAGALQASDADAQRRLSAMEVESAEQARTCY